MDRITGKTISYLASKSCFACVNRGLWRIQERDGLVLSAVSMDSDVIDPTSPPLLTQVLSLAQYAERFTVGELTDTSISVGVDMIIASADDEFGYTAYEITIES